MNRRKLSCFLIVRDEADRLEPCLKSLAGWVDQLVILDSGSRDETVKIARRYTDEVHETDWPGFGPQRNRALSLCRHDWVLNIDADERMTPALREEIDALLCEKEINATLVKIPWNTYIFGKPLRFGRYSTPQGKLFYKPGAQFKSRQVHETLLLPKEVSQTLKNRLPHYSWRSYQHMQQKHLQYACLLAEQKHAQGKRGRLSIAILRFFTDFTQQYIFRLGFLDGWRGLLMAIVLGQYAFHKYMALASLDTNHQIDTREQ